MTTDEMPVIRFDSKIAVVLLEELATWQKLNATAFLASGVAAIADALGEPYIDGSERTYHPMFRQPVLVFAADGEGLRRCYERAAARGVRMAIFTRELFATGHDAANRAAVRAVPSDRLDLVGLALRGERKEVDKIVKGLKLHG
jgi:hypothetical protein